MRHGLSDASVRAATVLGSWCEHPGLIPRTELTALFDNKSKRPKGNAKDAEQAGVSEEPTDIEITVVD